MLGSAVLQTRPSDTSIFFMPYYYILVRARPSDVARGVKIVAIAMRRTKWRPILRHGDAADSGSSLDRHRQLS